MLCDVAQDGSLKGPNVSQSVSPLSSLFHARERLLLSGRRVFMSCSNAVGRIFTLFCGSANHHKQHVVIITNLPFATGPSFPCQGNCHIFRVFRMIIFSGVYRSFLVLADFDGVFRCLLSWRLPQVGRPLGL